MEVLLGGNEIIGLEKGELARMGPLVKDFWVTQAHDITFKYLMVNIHPLIQRAEAEMTKTFSYTSPTKALSERQKRN